jgi:hypothetical protein
MTLMKKDVGRPIIFQGFDNGIYEGYIDKVHTTEFGYTFAHIMYRVPTCAEMISVPLSKKNWDRIAFRVTN